MEFSVKKLQDHVGANGKYAKHIHMYDVDSDEDTDYLAVARHYILCIPKKTITLNPEINNVKLVAAIINMANGATQDLKFYDEVVVDEYLGKKRTQLMFVNEEGEKIYVNPSFFTDFINGAYSKQKKAFADGITFTGSRYNEPVCMWNGEDLVGAFLPIVKR